MVAMLCQHVSMHVCRLQSAGSPTHMEDSTVQALARRQLTPDYQQDSASGGTRDSSGGIDPSQRATPSSQGGATSSQETTGSSMGTGSSRRGGHSRGSKHNGGVANTDTSLTISGVMPRRTELPSPSPSNSVSRVFKVIFLGKVYRLLIIVVARGKNKTIPSPS